MRTKLQGSVRESSIRSVVVAAIVVAWAGVGSSAWGIPVSSVPGLDSITFIENTGANKEFTFLKDDPALLNRLPDPLVAAPIRARLGLTSISFFESTGPTTEHMFGPNDLAIRNRSNDLTIDDDFEGVAGHELYDVFYSDRDGRPNEDGSYITVEATFDTGGTQGGGLNISEVRLNFGALYEPGTVITSAVYLGESAIPGSAALAVDDDLGTDCTMGNTVDQGSKRLRITIGFGDPTEDFRGTQTEIYDVFYSDANGNWQQDGAYITVEATFDQEAPSGGGLNISEVRLNRGAQSEYGNVVSSAVYLGDNQINGSAGSSVDGDMQTDCTMGNTVGLGNQRLRVTMGFGSSAGGTANPTKLSCFLEKGNELACNGGSGNAIAHFVNTGGPRQVEWSLDAQGELTAVPASGSFPAPNNGTVDINLDLFCGCPPHSGVVVLSATTTNGDTCTHEIEWTCNLIVGGGVPTLPRWQLGVLALSLLGIGSIFLLRRRPERR